MVTFFLPEPPHGMVCDNQIDCMSELIKNSTIAQAWLSAINYLQPRSDHCDFNLLLEITNPTTCPKNELAILNKIDDFLLKNKKFGLQTVANTIFPDQLYRRHGREGVFDIYPNKVYPRIKRCKENTKWGTYAHRLVHREDSKGNIINPLANILDRLEVERDNRGPKRARYELNLVNPFLDLSTSDPTLAGDSRALGGPCLSHLSFKLRPGGIVSLTAFYRSHYYVERALGNFVGLANLLNFVAKETSLEVGPLTCISSYAKVDTGGHWNHTEIRALVSECERLLIGNTLPAKSTAAHSV